MRRKDCLSLSTPFPQGDRHQVLQEEGAEEVTGGVCFPEAAWEEDQSGGEGGGELSWEGSSIKRFYTFYAEELPN